MNKLKFDELNLSPLVLKAIVALGFEETTPIQSESIPLLMQGHDITGHAQTGTGKTAAFAIPIIEGIEMDKTEIQALVICPTRELVIQVTDEFRKLLKYNDDVFVVPVYGGQEIDRQLRALKKFPQIIVGTPGRMMDHIKRTSIKLKKIKYVVLDEADEMLDMGFRDDIEFILKETPDTRQTIMFSATMPEQIKKLMSKYQKNPKTVDVTHHKLNAPKIEQVYFDIPEKAKPEALARLLDLHDIKLALVFCNTKNQVDNLVEVLKSRGYFADALHGDLSQGQREKVMNSFRSGSTEILVATDVAGRGIDVNDVEAVFNYDLPRDDEDYVHRIGRTGRAGKSGIAFTFVVGRQLSSLKRIEKLNDLKIVRRDIPTLSELDATRLELIAKEVKEIVNLGHTSKFVTLVEQMMGEDYSSIDIAAALLKMTIDVRNEGFDKNQDFQKNAYENDRRYDRDSRSEKRRSSRDSDGRGRRGGSGGGRGGSGGGKRFGDKKFGDKKFGDKKYGDKKYGDKKYDDKKSGDKSYGDKKYGDKKYGDKKFGDKKFGDKKFGDKKYGDKKAGKFEYTDFREKKSGEKKSFDPSSFIDGDRFSGSKDKGKKNRSTDKFFSGKPKKAKKSKRF
jgi:ATP-dependent RNA helicase DeaD